MIIALPAEAKKIKRRLGDSANWCYLGKDSCGIENITSALGEKNRFYLKSRLHKAADVLRKPYLDFVALLGRQQKDQLKWWASRFASRRPYNTDFFLLLCYKYLLSELVREKSADKNFIIFVEDRWLYSDIKQEYELKAEFMGSPGLLFLKSYYSIRGIMNRSFLKAWLIAAGLMVKKPDLVKKKVALMNFAEPRAFVNGKYTDNYMPGLAELYEKNDIHLFYIYPFPFPLSTAKWLKLNKDKVWPLIKNVKLLQAMKRLFYVWKPEADTSSMSISGIAVGLLFKREEWLEFSSASFNMNLILFDAFNDFFSKHLCDSVVYVFENQSSEKMLCLAAAKNGIRTTGYQHSSIWKLFLSQFPGKDEASFMPLPDTLLTSGTYFAGLYLEEGMPVNKVRVGGAWKYLYLLKEHEAKNGAKERNAYRKIVLIAMPRDRKTAVSMLKQIAGAYEAHSLGGHAEFWVKPHPDTPFEASDMPAGTSFKCRIVSGQLCELLPGADIMISTASTASLEAFLYGKKVIVYIPENIVPLDPLLDMEDSRIFKWHEGEPLDVDFLTGPAPAVNEADIKARSNDFFSDIKQEVWLDAVKHI